MASMRTIGVRLRLLVDGYKKDATEAGRATDDLSNKITKAGAKNQADLDRVAFAAAGAGAALLAAAGVTVVAAAKFEAKMSAVAAATDAAAGELEELRQAALDAGAATSFSASEAAQGIEELAKAGVSTTDILAGGLAGALDLAAAGGIEVAAAAETAASAMTQFGLEGDDVTHVADLFAAAAGKAQGGVLDLGQALAQVGLVANQTGLSIEETTGTLAAMASAGLIGSDAGTSLKTALQRLAAPTGEAQKTMDALGISMYDASGNMVDIATVAGQLERGLDDLAPAQRNAALQTIFGSDAIRAANVLYREGEGGIRRWIAAVDDQGAASRTAAARTDNLVGDLERLKGSLETLAIGAGSGSAGGLRVAVQGAESLVNAFAAIPAPVQAAGVALAGISGAGLLVGAGFVKARSVMFDVTESLTAMGPRGERAAKGLDRAAKAAGAAALAFAAVGAAGAIVGTVIGDDIDPAVQELTRDTEKWATGSALAGEAARVFGENADLLSRGLAGAAGSGFSQWMDDVTAAIPGFNTTILEANQRVALFDQQLAMLVADGNAEAAAGLLEHMAAKAGLSVEQLVAVLPAYRDALASGAKGTDDLADSTEELARQQLGAFEAGQKLVELWEQLNGATKTADEQMLDAVEAVDAVTKAFEGGEGALIGNTRAALENRLALQEAAQQAYEAADAYLANGGSANGAAEILERFKTESAAAAIAAGGNAEQVRVLNDQLYRMPPQRRTTVVIDYKIGARPQGISGLAAFSVFRHGGVVEHAADGLLREPATFRAGSSPLYGFAEPETGGEAFVPKRGDYGRSMGILQQAAGWYGADVVPRDASHGGTGGAAAVNVNLTISPKAGSGRGVMQEIVKSLRVEVGAAGGDVQTYLGRR